MKPLNLFYEEPDPDRWFKFDRYPRKIIRNLFRGPQRPGGVQTVAINLLAGLDRLNIPYRFNDYSYVKKHPEELACIIGKPHILFEKEWENPILFGAGIFSHPIDCPDLFEQYPKVKHLLVPGEWMQKMFEPFYGNRVSAWPTGIDTEKWKPSSEKKTVDFLIYEKILWEYDRNEKELLNPIKRILTKFGLSTHEIKYGSYVPKELEEKLKISKAVIFLCEHETQGIAYQQILATNTPILAWDNGGFWLDPGYYPNKVQYRPVSSVPYWDERCGLKFEAQENFEAQLRNFMNLINKGSFNPRNYILKNLTIEKCARDYSEIANGIINNLL